MTKPIQIMASEKVQARRKRQREIVNYLRSDLYERVGWPEHSEDGMAWESPLKWRVEIICDLEGEDQQLDVTIRSPDGEVLENNPDADIQWLENVLP